MIINTGFAGIGSTSPWAIGRIGLGAPRRTGRTGRGLGQTDPLTAWYEANPQCVTASGGDSTCVIPQSVIQADATYNASQPQYGSAVAYQSPALQSAAANPTSTTFTSPGIPGTSTGITLASWMAQWAQEQLALPGGAGTDPQTAALTAAQQRCAVIQTSDCGNLTSIAANTATQISNALARAQVSAGAPGTTSASQPTSVMTSGASRGAAGRANQAWAQSAATPVVVQPSPPTLPTTTGSSVTAPASVTSIANGSSLADEQSQQTTTTQDIIPGIDNSMLIIGGGAAVLLFVMVSRK